MCIIAVKRRGVVVPSDIEQILRACWYNNQHGAGYMIKRQGEKEITFKKGFKYFPEFLAAFKNLKVDKNDEFCAHFRIATHGSMNVDMTHPFVVSRQTAQVEQMEGTVRRPCMMHNGMMGGLKQHDKYSDSFLFARDILGYYNPDAGERAMKKWVKRMREIVKGQRLCIMYPDREVELLGHYVYSRGMYFSNGGYKPYKYHEYQSSRMGYKPTVTESDDDEYAEAIREAMCG